MGLQRVGHGVGHDRHTYHKTIDQATYEPQEFPTVLEAERVGERAAVGTITPHLSPTESSGLNVCVPSSPDGYAEILCLNMIQLDSEAFGRWLWLSEAMKLEPHGGLHALA